MTKNTKEQQQQTGMIFSFYSYKGGVGRSQLCANVAAYLCHKKNKRVLLLDWDFEAPGLHYYFGKKDTDLQVKGSLELLEDYTAMMLTQEKVSQEDYQGVEPANIINVLTAKGWKEETRGCVDLIPAGYYDQEYSNRINNFNWFQFYNRLDGKVYIEWLKKQLKQLHYDYILIDSRTGINDYSGICNLHLPDANIVVMAANSQNIMGCKNLIDQIIHHPYTQHENQYRTKYILPVLSRINVNNPNFDHWADQFVQHFQPLMEHWETALPNAFKADIFRDFYLEKTLLEDMPQYSAGENILFERRGQRIHRSSFAAKFANLAQYLEDLKEKGKIQLEEQVDRDAWEYYAQEAELLYKEGKEDITRKEVAFAYEQAGDRANAERFGGTVELFLEEFKDYFVAGKYEEAERVLLEVLKIDNKNVDAYMGLSRVYERLKQRHKAIDILQRAINAGIKSEDIYFEIGVLYDYEKHHNKAIENYQRALEIKSDDHYALNNMGGCYYEICEYDKAIESYQKALDIKPDKHEAYNNMGSAYGEKGELDKAIESYQKAIDIKPDFHEAYNNMGVAYNNKGETAKAIACHQKALEIKPDFYQARHNLGYVYEQKGELQQAIQQYKKAIQINYQFIPSREALASLYQSQNQPQKAQKILQELQELEPSNPQWPIQLARLYRQQQQWQAAKTTLDKALQTNQKAILETLKNNSKEDPQNPEVYIELGRAYHQLHRWGKALNNYEKALQLAPNHAIASTLIGNVYSSKGSWHIALEYYHKSLSINPNSDYIHYRLGYAYVAIGNYPAAIEHYQKSLALNPNNKSSRNNLGVAYHKNGQSQQAVEIYLQSLTMDEDHEVYNNNIGYLYLMTGELEKAFHYLQHSLELGLLDFANRNLGHYHLIKEKQEQALAHYQASWQAFETKAEFWSGMENDFQYLKQYGLTLDTYEAIKTALLDWIAEQEQ